MLHIGKTSFRFMAACFALSLSRTVPQPAVNDTRVSTRVALAESGCAAQQLDGGQAHTAGPEALTGTNVISGYATVSGTGVGVPGITVMLYGCYLLDPGGSLMQTVTGWNGYYQFLGLAAGVYGLNWYPSYSAPDWVSTYYSVGGNVRKVSIGNASTTVVNITLAPGGWITGRVTNAQGAPLPGVLASAGPANTAFRGGMAPSNAQARPRLPGALESMPITDSDGRFTISGLKPGDYSITFGPPSYGAAYGYAITRYPSTVAVSAGYTNTNINAVLSPGGVITGRVTGADTGLGILPAAIFLDGINVFYSASDNTSNFGSDGSYRFVNLPPGTYRLHAFDANRGSKYMLEYYNNKTTSETADLVTVTAGVTTTNVNFALDPGAQVAGSISDTWGYPQRFVGVQVLDIQGNVVASDTTDIGGSYITSPGLPSGTYWVRFGTGASLWFCEFPLYPTRYYSGSNTLAGATPLVLSAGAVRNNVNAVMEPLVVNPVLFLPVMVR